MPDMARKLALLIGNDSYTDPRLRPLVVPTEDVRALHAVLADPAIGGFDEVRPLLNAERTAVAGEIEDLFRQAGRADLVLLYFSGHGILDRHGRLYLALAGSDLDRPVATALRADDVRDLMEEGRSTRQILILDCCYSGAFARAAKGAGEVPAVTPETFDTQGEGRVALLSSTATQRSFEGTEVLGDTERSLFTHHLVEGLATGAAAAGEAQVTEEALFHYAYDRVRAAGAGMTPQRWVGRQHGRLVIARNPAWRPDPLAGLPEAVLRALEDPEPYVREGAVRELGRRLADPERRDAARTLLEARRDQERDRIVYAVIVELLEARPGPVDRAELTAGGDSGEEPPAGNGAVNAATPSPPSPALRAGAVWVGATAAALLAVGLGSQFFPSVAPDDPEPPSVGPAEIALPPPAGGPEGAQAVVLAGPSSSEVTEPFEVFRDRLKDGSEGPEMVALPGGSFSMGSPDDEPERDFDEGPRREVTIAPFALGRTEVNFADYNYFAQATGRALPGDSGWGRGNRPVINVSWRDASAYAEWLSAQTGQDYRLPSEAEWEYAARAGTIAPFWTGDCIHTDQANYNGIRDYDGCGAKTMHYRHKTVPVGSLPANPWGLHEVAGNVWEWTKDCWHDGYRGAPMDGSPWLETFGGDCGRRVLRGGSWNSDSKDLRSGNRYRNSEDGTTATVGFRIARSFPD